jgi:predicted metal-binding protein
MVDRGAEAIAFASCISDGKPLGMPCPHYELIKEAVAKKLGPDIMLLDYTH